MSIELLAPGGDIDSIKAAIIAGANAVYCGLDRFNARNSATNIRFDDLAGILHLAHSHGCQVFLTLNIVITESEVPALVNLLNKLVNTSIDGIIIQDLGVFYLVSTFFKSLNIHASTQCTTHNVGQLRFLHALQATRVNLSRELNIDEIRCLTREAHAQDVQVEVFVHGSYCICFSGLCYMGSANGGHSGNRGRCSQPCRDQYITTQTGHNFPLNLKDNSAYTSIGKLAEAGVDSCKIEGRIKKFHYVYTVVGAWRQQIDRLERGKPLIDDTSLLYSVFNRDFSSDFLDGTISRDSFIDNPRDHSALHLASHATRNSIPSLDSAKGQVYEQRTAMIASVERLISQLSTDRPPVSICLAGGVGEPLALTVTTPNNSFVLCSDVALVADSSHPLDRHLVLSRFKAVGDAGYILEKIDMSGLQAGVGIPFGSLTKLKNDILKILHGARDVIKPVDLPVLQKHHRAIPPVLAVLVSSVGDIHLCRESQTTTFFEIPAFTRDKLVELIDLFSANRSLIPWFPPVLIGDDYTAAVEFLQRVRPSRVVTNNTGIAHEAFLLNIEWIAGPFMNIANSYSLLCLKKMFNCTGAFISGELNRLQVKAIKKPDDFDLYYTIFHPLMLMTSRHCLFHHVTGCGKNAIDKHCTHQCTHTSRITNLKNESFVVEKSAGHYHGLYADKHCLNTAVIADVPGTFTAFMADLRDIPTSTVIACDKQSLIELFKQVVDARPGALDTVQQLVHHVTNQQYMTGI